MRRLLHAQYEQIEKFAYQLWEDRGRPFGSSDEDWFRAQWEFMRGPDSRVCPRFMRNRAAA